MLGLGLYARYQREPEAFKASYHEFLSSTGMADAVTLGKRFDADVQSIDFWRSSLDVIWKQIAEFEIPSGGVKPPAGSASGADHPSDGAMSHR